MSYKVLVSYPLILGNSACAVQASFYIETRQEIYVRYGVGATGADALAALAFPDTSRLPLHRRLSAEGAGVSGVLGDSADGVSFENPVLHMHRSRGRRTGSLRTRPPFPQTCERGRLRRRAEVQSTCGTRLDAVSTQPRIGPPA